MSIIITRINTNADLRTVRTYITSTEE